MSVVSTTYAVMVAGGGLSNFNLAVALMWISDMFSRKSSHAVSICDIILAATPILGVELSKRNVLLPRIVHCSGSPSYGHTHASQLDTARLMRLHQD